MGEAERPLREAGGRRQSGAGGELRVGGGRDGERGREGQRGEGQGSQATVNAGRFSERCK